MPQPDLVSESAGSSRTMIDRQETSDFCSTLNLRGRLDRSDLRRCSPSMHHLIKFSEVRREKFGTKVPFNLIAQVYPARR